MAWSPEGEGSPLNRRDSVMSITTPPSSSLMDGVRNDFVESLTTPPSPSCVDGVRSSDLDSTPSTHLQFKLYIGNTFVVSIIYT